jgi:hypothetical protein
MSTFEGRFRHTPVADFRTSQGILYVVVRRYKKWAKLVLPIIISSLKDLDIDTVKGALHTLRLSTIEHTLARNWEFTGDYVSAVFEAFENFDRVCSLMISLMKPSVQNNCLSAITSLGRYNKAKPWKKSVDESVYEPIRPEGEIDEKIITTIQLRRQKKMALAQEKISDLVPFRAGFWTNSRLCSQQMLSSNRNGGYLSTFPDSLG